MKGKRKVILGSALAIAMSASMIAGGTLALFTSESSVNIAVTSAKVSVSAAVKESSVWTKQLNTEYTAGIDGVFSDSVELSKEGLTVKNFVPGDGVKFTIDIENGSTVTVKYRTVFKLTGDEELVNALKVTYDGTVYQNAETEGAQDIYDGLAVYTQWTTLGESKQVPVEIELPDADNSAQDKSFNISYRVEAVQGNANVTDKETTLYHSEYEGDVLKTTTTHYSLQEAFDNAKLNDTISLNKDFTLTEKLTLKSAATKGLTIKGNNHTVTLRCKSYGLQFGESGNTADKILIENMTIKGAANGAIYFYGGANADNVLQNVAVSGKYVVASVSFAQGGGGKLIDSKIINQIAPEKGFYYPYGFPLPLGIFANRQVSENQKGAILFKNSTVDTVQVNGSKTEYASPKLNLDETSHIDMLYEGYIDAAHRVNPIANDYSKIDAAQGHYANGFYQDMKESRATGKDIFYVEDAAGLKAFSSLANNGFVGNGHPYAVLNGSEVRLLNDIDLENAAWTPIGTKDYTFGGTFEGNGHTIKNFTVNNKEYAGLFGKIYGTVQNLTVENANITSNHYAGAIAGYMANKEPNNDRVSQLINCHVIGSTVVANPELVGDNLYDNGDKVGGLAGYFGQKAVAQNCTVKNSELCGFRDVGGLFGNCITQSVDNCTVENVTVALKAHDGEFKDNTLGNAIELRFGAILGSLSSVAKDKDWSATGTNTAANCTYVSYAQDGSVVSSRAMTEADWYQVIVGE